MSVLRHADESIGRFERPASWSLAAAFVILTLVALVLVPWLVQRRVSALRDEIVASEPARTRVMQWQLSLIREISALNELLLTGDTAQVALFGAALESEEAIHPRLELLVRQLGPGVIEQYAEARTLAEQWHARVDDEALARLRGRDTEAAEFPREYGLFQDVIESTAAVDSAILAATDAIRADIEEAERAGLRFTLLLGGLALLAAGAVIALLVRARNSAAEAERRRNDADTALAESQRAAQARARLLRGITHDVKNPLGAARGYAELLAMGIKAPVAPAQTPLLEGIERSIDSALAIIADLLDFARAESGEVKLHRVEVDLNQLTAEAVDDYRPAAENAGHQVEARTDGEPLMVHTDPVRVRQVLDNLLSNALKYTPPPGRIVVHASMHHGGDGPRPGSWAKLQVSDTGPGVPPEHRERVFDEFTRLDENSPIKGHGLGLPIARNLARQLGGDLTIADSDSGATFVLWIPQRFE